MAKAARGAIVHVAQILKDHGLISDSLADIRRIELTVDGERGVELVVHKWVDYPGLLGAFTALAEHGTLTGKEEPHDG
jgi:hypothetical protein